MSSILGTLGRAVVRFRWAVVVLWILLTVLSIRLLPSLSSVVDTQNAAFLPANEPSVRAASLEGPFQSTKAAQAILVASNTDGAPLSAADQAAVTAAEHSLARVPKVLSVQDLASSKSGRARIASVEADVPLAGSVANNEVSLLRQTLTEKSFEGVSVPPSLTFSLTGPLAISADNAKANQAAQARTEALTYVIILLILLLVYRSALAWLINLIPAGIVLALSQPVVGELAKHGLPASGVTPIIMTVLVLGAGTDYGLFLIMRFRESLEDGDAPGEAVVRALAGVGESITFAGLTVAGALFCLILSSFGIYQGLGPSLAIAIVLMLLASLTLTPALLAIFGRRTFWPSQIRAGAGHHEGLWARVAEWGAGRPAATLLSGVVVLGVLVGGLAGLHTVGFSGGNSSPAGSQSARATAVLEANFPPSVLNPTDLLLVFPASVWSTPDGLGRLEQAQGLIARSPLVRQVSGPLRPLGYEISPAQLQALYRQLGPPGDLPVTAPPSVPAADLPLYGLYRSVGQYVSRDGKTVQFALTLPGGDPTSSTAVTSVPGLRRLASSVARQTGADNEGVYGIAAYSYDVERVANHDLLLIFPVVALVIAVLLALLLRSLVAPIFLLLSVALSYGSTLGLTNLFFVHLGGQPGMNFIVPFLLFVFLVALGEDYNILVMSRIREESLSLGTSGTGGRRAVVRAVAATGTTVTSAGIILAGTFGAFAVAGGSSQLAEIGTALTLGILLDTFVVRTLLVPSTVQLLGRWTWWPSRLSRLGDRRPPPPPGSPGLAVPTSIQRGDG